MTTTNDAQLAVSLAVRGAGLIYIAEPFVRTALREGRLKVVLDEWAPRVPGLFLYFPSRARASPVLRAFVEMARLRS